MKITCISDTHNYHHNIKLPGGDVLIHAGDISGRGLEKEVKDFLNWFSKQAYTHKIFIAGNHDFYFERNNEQTIKSIIPKNVIYLNDSSINIEGIKFYGSPITPFFYNWAFNRRRGAEIKKHWDLIPNDVDVLITHGPPFGMLDKTKQGDEVGCKELSQAINTIKPKYHIFGHIHEAYGNYQNADTHFINASVLNERYVYTNEPITFNL